MNTTPRLYGSRMQVTVDIGEGESVKKAIEMLQEAQLALGIDHPASLEITGDEDVLEVYAYRPATDAEYAQAEEARKKAKEAQLAATAERERAEYARLKKKFEGPTEEPKKLVTVAEGTAPGLSVTVQVEK